jgi:sulfoxide reductase catalytic subunit YedY
MKEAVGLTAGAALLAACGGRSMPEATSEATATASPPPTSDPQTTEAPEDLGVPMTPSAESDELGYEVTPYEAVTGFCNYYEFTLDKERVDELAADFPTSPWQVEVGGLVQNPRTFDLDDLRAFEMGERIYRLRCVEAWSMVVPWMGFPLAKLLSEVEPMGSARYVRFQTAFDPDQMPGTDQPFPWPYVEGLRLDEAMHDLTLLATGLYGKWLPPQNGAPVRLVVPWKYGFKSIKSIVKIDLVEEMPENFWAAAGPAEYGFWANVNPEVPHPRWSQATERVIGEGRRRETLFLNGYAEEVADLYDDLDNRKWYY